MVVSPQPRQARKSSSICALPLPSLLSNFQSTCPACPDLVGDPVGKIPLGPGLSTSASSYPLSLFFSTTSELFSRLLHTTAAASLFFSATYKLFAVTTGVAYNGAPSKGSI